jgi:hypothetical protein
MAKNERIDCIEKIRNLQEENKNDPCILHILKVAEDQMAKFKLMWLISSVILMDAHLKHNEKWLYEDDGLFYYYDMPWKYRTLFNKMGYTEPGQFKKELNHGKV